MNTDDVMKPPPCEKRKRVKSESGENQDTPSAKKIKDSSVSQPKDKPPLTVTDVGAIKVSIPRVKKKGKSKSKKSKSKRLKLDISSLPNQEGELDGEDLDLTDSSKPNTNELSSLFQWNKAALICHSGRNLITIAFDEIALEGLDGITLEALWTRLCIALSTQPPLTRQLMEYIWKAISMPNNVIVAYLLETPRAKLVFPHLTNGSEDIYPYQPVNIDDTGVMGSCSTYNLRQTIDILNFSLSQVEEAFGNRLVIVGTQELRSNALMSQYADPRFKSAIDSFVIQHYCVLEKIGRSRRHGDTTTGFNSLSNVIKDSKTLFYYRNQLQQMQLITKQMTRWRTERNVAANGGLLHLTRFHVELKHERQLIIEHIIKIIKQKPNCRMEYMELRRLIGRDSWEKYAMSKTIKSPEFRQFIKTDLVLPYRAMYPHATRSEWRRKSKEHEKVVRVLELRNPNLNVNCVFKQENGDDIKMPGPVNEFENEEISVHPYGVLSMQRTYEAICQAGPAGVTLRRLSQRADCDHHTARHLCKVLQREGKIFHTLHDSKRQHYLVYIATMFLKAAIIEPFDIEDNEEVFDQEECDDDTNNFISNVLNFDSIPMDNSVEYTPVEPTFNDYSLIEYFRENGQETALNNYFANKHDFEIATVRSLNFSENQILNEKTKSFLVSLFNSADSRSGLPKFAPTCQFNITENLPVIRRGFRQRHKLRKRRPKRTLHRFKPFRRLLNRKYRLRDFDYYAEMIKGYKNCLFTGFASDDEILEEAFSDIAIENGLQGKLYDKIPQFIKQTFLDNFEELNVTYREKLYEPNLELLEYSENYDDDSMSKENFFDAYMELFMGPKPWILSYNKDDQGVETLLVSSTVPENFPHDRKFVSDSHRVRIRMHIIKDCVNAHKAAVDLYKIQGIINRAERDEGYEACVDRKSLHRIFATLVRAGEIKIVKIVMRFQKVIRTKSFIIAPHHYNDSVMQSGIDQFRNSFVIYAKRKVHESEDRALGESERIRKKRFKYSRLVGRSYGFNPKVSKMRLLHEFLFYLMREYTGFPITRIEARYVFLQSCDEQTIDNVMDEATTVFQRDCNWRMFIPPLPQHKEWPSGWALISDLLLRLPLSLFVKIFNVTYIIPALPSYLNHPIRKHYLVKNLPADIKDALLGSRKYIFSIYEIICYNAYMGLIQFGPQKMREKDQIFIYLNRKAIFYDTISSENGYHHVTKKEYPLFTYEFNTIADVEKYWADLYYHAINTKLGNRASVIGQHIKLEYVHSKPVLQQTLIPQTPESALAKDVGYLPGDGLGACCSDSAVWLYVKKNWHWNSKPSRNNLSNQQIITGHRRKHLDDVRPMKLSDIYHHRKGKKFKLVSVNAIPNRLRYRGVIGRSVKKTVILRKVKPRMDKIKKRLRTDAVDRRIRDRAGKSRAIFTSEEDKVVMISLVCMDYLTYYNRKRAVTTVAFRDFMHRMVAHSRKTSQAYRRRGMYLRKSGTLENFKEELNLYITQDFFTVKHFEKFRCLLKRRGDKDDESIDSISDTFLNLAFIYLTYFIYKKLHSDSDSKLHHLEQQDLLAIASNHPDQIYTEQEEFYCKDPINEDEINLETIQSVIHSSLGGHNNDQKWPFQVLRVYQSFPENLLRNAITNMRDYQIISGKKLKLGQEGTIIMSGITYNLSFNYTFKQITLFPHCIFQQADDFLYTIVNRFDQMPVDGVFFEKFEQGYGLGIGEIQTIRDIEWVFDLPEDFISLNPKLDDFSELIIELSQRYNELMKRSTDFHDPEVITQLESALRRFKEQGCTSSPDSDPEDDPEDDIISDTTPESDTTHQSDATPESDTTPQSDTAHQSVIAPQSDITPQRDDRSPKSDDGTPKSDDIIPKNDIIPKCEPEISSEESSLDDSFSSSDSSSSESPPEESYSEAMESFSIDDDPDYGSFDAPDKRTKKWRISDMAFMLTKGLFPELDDDDRLKKLNEHFIVRHPKCGLQVFDSRAINNSIFKNWHQTIVNDSKAILKEVAQNAIISNTLPETDAFDLQTQQLLTFIYRKQAVGASSKELKNHFPKDCVKSLEILLKIGVVLRVGVCNFAFVHHNYRHSWTICFNNDNNDENTVGYRLQVTPWIRINGEVDEKTLEKWMSIIIGHCLTYPSTPFNRLCARFNIIKPVDLYYLIEILQRLGCLQIWSYVNQVHEPDDLFTEFNDLDQVPSNTIDDFDDVFVEIETSAITKFGAFLNRDKTDFAYMFQEDI